MASNPPVWEEKVGWVQFFFHFNLLAIGVKEGRRVLLVAHFEQEAGNTRGCKKKLIQKKS